MKTKSASKSPKKKKTKSVQQEDLDLIRYFKQRNEGEELVEKIFSMLMERQDAINQQLDKIEKRYIQQLDEKNRLIEESTQNALQRMEGKKRHIEEVGSKVNQQFINNIYRSDDEYEEDSNTGSKRRRKKKGGSSALGADTAVIEMFIKKGYAIHGAIVGNNFTDTEKQEILQAGLFLIEQYGKSFVLNTPDGFVPKKV